MNEFITFFKLIYKFHTQFNYSNQTGLGSSSPPTRGSVPTEDPLSASHYKARFAITENSLQHSLPNHAFLCEPPNTHMPLPQMDKCVCKKNNHFSLRSFSPSKVLLLPTFGLSSTRPSRRDVTPHGLAASTHHSRRDVSPHDLMTPHASHDVT